MNIFLFAPALLILMLIDIGLAGAVACIALCALIQLVVGAPLFSMAYLSGAFRGFEIYNTSGV